MDKFEEFKNLIEIPNISKYKINETGGLIAYTLEEANWKDNKYDSDCYLYEKNSGNTYKLTHSGDIIDFNWIDINDLLLLKPDANKNNQLWVIQALRGEPVQLTNEENGIQSFWVSNNHLFYKTSDLTKFNKKSRTEKFGEFTHVEEERPSDTLFYSDVTQLIEYKSLSDKSPVKELKNKPTPKLSLTAKLEDPLSISNLAYSPANNLLIFTGTPKGDLVFMKQKQSYSMSVNPKKELKEFIDTFQREPVDDSSETNHKDKNDNKFGLVSSKPNILDTPPGAAIMDFDFSENFVLFRLKLRDQKFYTLEDIVKTSVESIVKNRGFGNTELEIVSNGLNRSIMGFVNSESGDYFGCFEGTRGKIKKLNSSGVFSKVILPEEFHGAFISGNKQGDLVILGMHRERPNQLVLRSQDGSTSIITSIKGEIEKISSHSIETISWESRDGTKIEGVLHSPANLNDTPNNSKLPLVFVVHGGPSWVSYESPFSRVATKYYPISALVSQGMIVVEPNYRGSIGRGQEFLELNVNNLGIGDLWDIEGCIDHLNNLGIIDENNVSCVGWSQGGYISAMAATHSNRFRAVSVGAGISDWYSYYITTDIREFTRDYLSSNPFKNRDIYNKTSPMSKINQANTPALIQIGEFDKRVPPVNATELYRGLKDKGVPTHLFVFNGFPHGINKPKENLAILAQNFEWISHYQLGGGLLESSFFGT